MRAIGILVVSFAGVVALLVIVFGLGWLVEGHDFFMYRYFAPQRAEVERQVFENTKSYNDGMAKELDAMHFEYAKSNPQQKAALASIILHRVSGYDESRLSRDTQDFLGELRHSRDLAPSTQPY
jgi:hypothetical protein